MISSDKALYNKLRNMILNELIHKVGNLFPTLDEHDMDHEVVNEDLHPFQLVKEIIKRFLTMRLLRYGQNYTESIIQKRKVRFAPKM